MSVMSSNTNGHPMIDLSVAEAVYGKQCDLYKDVLHVSPKASPQKIQEAYFERRKQLFQELSRFEEVEIKTKSTEMKRRRAERKMDALVGTVRILGDADLRKKYNDLRRRQKSPKSSDSIPGLNDTTNSTVTDSSEREEYSTCDVNEAEERRRKVSPRKARFSPDTAKTAKKTTKRTPVVDENDSVESGSLLSEEGTFLTYDDELEEVELPKPPEGLLDRVRMELLGALDDTSRSFEQVFNAFTLSENDIDAVVRRINKAKNQIVSQGKLPRRR